MKILLKAPKIQSLRDYLKTLKSIIVNLEALPREEEHTLIVEKVISDTPILAAPLAALVEQKRRSGCLLKLKNNGLKSTTLIETKKRSKDEPKIESIISIFSEKRPDLRTTLLYCIGELIDNIFEHAQTSFGVVAFGSSNRNFSLAVGDTGISIPAAYRKVGMAIKSDSDALSKAISGISTKTVDERGEGLISIKRIITQGLAGQLTLLSAGAVLESKREEIISRPMSIFWQGTIVNLSGTIPREPLNLYQYVQ